MKHSVPGIGAEGRYGHGPGASPLVVVRVVEVASVDRGQGRVVVRLQEKIRSSPIQSVGSHDFVETVVKVFVVYVHVFQNLETKHQYYLLT